MAKLFFTAILNLILITLQSLCVHLALSLKDLFVGCLMHSFGLAVSPTVTTKETKVQLRESESQVFLCSPSGPL